MVLAPLEFRGASWDFSRPLLMGVLNLTPDSFSDGGRYDSLDAALRHAERMIGEGADCLDLGGESTRPGAPTVDAEEETRRVIPVVEALHKRFNLPISVDTCKAAVAERAVEAGAELINDVSGGLFDKEMFNTLERLGAAYICGHVRGSNLAEVHAGACDQADQVYEELGDRLNRMPPTVRHRVILDPCLGFGKSLACNIELMHGAGTLRDRFGKPVLIGASRKRFLGALTGHDVHDRDAATVGSSIAAIVGGAQILRVHEVGMNRAALRVFTANARAEADA